MLHPQTNHKRLALKLDGAVLEGNFLDAQRLCDGAKIIATL